MAQSRSLVRHLRFPDGFLWGAGTSAHQVEGCNVNSDWWRAEEAGTVPYHSDRACDSWNRWEEDLRLLRHGIGLNAYRFSVEWARIEPEPGRFDQKVVDHYRRMVETARELGVEPIVTLHHFTNPIWLADRGGWTNGDTPARFARYTDHVARAFGDNVSWWVTVNEPSVAPLAGYIAGLWPPHRRNDVSGYIRYMRNVLKGHTFARQALRASRGDAMASMAFHLNPLHPLSGFDPTDHIASWVYDFLWQGILLLRAAPVLDWVGVNYYFRLQARWDIWPWRLFEPPVQGPGQRSDLNWEIYPRGLYTVLKRASRFRKPVMVTENGVADRQDRLRASFIREHLFQAHRAIQDGVDLRGYMHWSLLDNYEWAEGYAMRFGLAEVDFATGRRTLRPSAHVYGAIARANAITLEAPATPAPASQAA